MTQSVELIKKARLALTHKPHKKFATSKLIMRISLPKNAIINFEKIAFKGQTDPDVQKTAVKEKTVYTSYF